MKNRSFNKGLTPGEIKEERGKIRLFLEQIFERDKSEIVEEFILEFLTCSGLHDQQVFGILEHIKQDWMLKEHEHKYHE